MAQVSSSLMSRGQARSDQHAVWADIRLKAAHLKAESSTAAMSDIYERYTKRIDDYVGAFAAIDRQVGAVFTINGNIVGFDLFDFSGTFKKLLPKLVRSYALDAIDTDTKKAAPRLANRWRSCFWKSHKRKRRPSRPLVMALTCGSRGLTLWARA